MASREPRTGTESAALTAVAYLVPSSIGTAGTELDSELGWWPHNRVCCCGRPSAVAPRNSTKMPKQQAVYSDFICPRERLAWFTRVTTYVGQCV